MAILTVTKRNYAESWKENVGLAFSQFFYEEEIDQWSDKDFQHKRVHDPAEYGLLRERRSPGHHLKLDALGVKPEHALDGGYPTTLRNLTIM